MPCIALVERGGEVRAKHVADVTAKTLREALVKQRQPQVHAEHRRSLGLSLAWARSSRPSRPSTTPRTSTSTKDGVAHTSTVEAFFAIFKRGVIGSFHSVSEQHLQRYVDEFAFRWNTRSALGVEDSERATLILEGCSGKRLTYRPTDKAQDA